LLALDSTGRSRRPIRVPSLRRADTNAVARALASPKRRPSDPTAPKRRRASGSPLRHHRSAADPPCRAEAPRGAPFAAETAPGRGCGLHTLAGVPLPRGSDSPLQSLAGRGLLTARRSARCLVPGSVAPTSVALLRWSPSVATLAELMCSSGFAAFRVAPPPKWLATPSALRPRVAAPLVDRSDCDLRPRGLVLVVFPEVATFNIQRHRRRRPS
jgi:hypothetical protein